MHHPTRLPFGEPLGLLVMAAAVSAACCLAPTPSHAQIVLVDVTRETGISFVHTDGSSGRRHIVETVCCGLATFDYDGDGDVDIYFLNGAPLRGTTVRTPPRNALYRNDGGWRFTDVTGPSGLGDAGYALGVAVGDYDNDGHPDVYVNNFGANALYRNRGDGTFEDVTRKAGVGDDERHVGAGACFLDMDGDGDLDLFVSHYVGFTYENHVTCRFNGYPAYVGPMNYPQMPNRLYRNEGDGTFRDVSVSSGIAAHSGSGMGVVCLDHDDDGDTDVYVCNDCAGNFLFSNDGKGRFTDVGVDSGLAYDYRGDAQASMGADCADFDADGRLDLYVTSYQQETATLYRGLGGGVYEDVTRRTGAGAGTFNPVTWGPAFADFDLDGDKDVYVACGHLHDNVELFDNVASYEVRNLLLMNAGEGRFVNVSGSAGDGLLVKRSSRGVAVDDLDGDGDPDVVVLNSRKEPTILRNDTPRKGHWLQLVLRGTRTNRDGIGARVRVTAGGKTTADEVHSGRGYQSHFGTRLHFGLGERERADRIEVRWIGGGTDIWTDVPADRVVTLREGESGASSGAR